MTGATPDDSDTLLDWRELHDRLARRRSELSANELGDLADALFWMDRLQDSLDVRRDAYQSFVAAGDHQHAALTTWRLFYEHFLVGELVVANGWLERCRRHVTDDGATDAEGWLAVAETDIARMHDDIDLAIACATRACDIGRADGDADLVAMGLQALGRAEIAGGNRLTGLRRLDEAMVSVINDELGPLFTGWVYCNVVSTCIEIADLRRASEWSRAAMRWCATLRDGRMYRGLCRVYAVELSTLRGEWHDAIVDAGRACDELTTHDARYAGEAFYLVGDIHRLRGEQAEAESAFRRASELGRLPQPGLALLRADRGHPEEALAALRTGLRSGPTGLLPRVRLLTEVAALAVACDEPAHARAAAAEIAGLAAAADSDIVMACSDTADALVSMAAGDSAAAADGFRRALGAFSDLGIPYEAARTRERLGVVASDAGDDETAELELTAAARAFDALGAEPDAARARRRRERLSANPASAAVDSPLTGRELDVLRLVAAGHTNREIGAELSLSRHTIARHVSNLMTKLGVSSRAAATAVAYEHGWVGSR